MLIENHVAKLFNQQVILELVFKFFFFKDLNHIIFNKRKKALHIQILYRCYHHLGFQGSCCG